MNKKITILLLIIFLVVSFAIIPNFSFADNMRNQQAKNNPSVYIIEHCVRENYKRSFMLRKGNDGLYIIDINTQNKFKVVAYSNSDRATYFLWEDINIDLSKLKPISDATVASEDAIEQDIEQEDVYFTILSSCGYGGTIQPSGTVKVKKGLDQTFGIWPFADFEISNVVVDGVSVGPVYSYTFYNVNSNHTITAYFNYNPPPPPDPPTDDPEPPPECLLPGTKIYVVDKKDGVIKEKLIEDIDIEDIVVGVETMLYNNTNLWKVTTSKITNKIMVTNVVGYYEIQLDTGETLNITGGHIVYLHNGEVKKIKDLRAGYKILVLDKKAINEKIDIEKLLNNKQEYVLKIKPATIISFRYKKEKIDIYNLMSDKTNNFFTNNVLVADYNFSISNTVP